VQGVWFAAINPIQGKKDALEYSDLVQQSITLVKEERHGVPFGLYTSGILTSSSLPPLEKIGLDYLQVSLFAGSPVEYAKATRQSEKDAIGGFGQVCALIAEAAELGVAVEVGVLKDYAASATDLAMSLGARHVHTFL